MLHSVSSNGSATTSNLWVDSFDLAISLIFDLLDRVVFFEFYIFLFFTPPFPLPIPFQ